MLFYSLDGHCCCMMPEVALVKVDNMRDPDCFQLIHVKVLEKLSGGYRLLAACSIAHVGSGSPHEQGARFCSCNLHCVWTPKSNAEATQKLLYTTPPSFTLHSARMCSK